MSRHGATTFALLAALLLAGCYQQPGPIDNYRARSLVLEQVSVVDEGVATLRLVARSPDIRLEDVRIVVDGETLRNATGCPPPEGAWAWCGDAELRAGDHVQVRAGHGSTLRVVDRVSDGVLLTLQMR